MDEAENTMAEQTARLVELSATYEKLISTDDERQNWKKVQELSALYMQHHAQLLEKSRENLNAEAAAIFSGKNA